MKNKDLTGIVAITEIVSGIAVVVSLVLLIIGMQKNTEAVNSATLQAATDSSNDFLLTVLDNPELRRIMGAGHVDYNSLSDEDKSTYSFMMRNRWFRFQSNYSQWQRGVLDDDDWSFYRRLICSVPATHGTALSWGVHIGVLNENFVSEVEACGFYQNAKL